MCDNSKKKDNNSKGAYIWLTIGACSSCRLSDSGEDAKVKGPDYLGAWDRLMGMANSLQYFRTELDFSVTGIAKTRVR